MYLWPSVIQNAGHISRLTVLIDTGPSAFDWNFHNQLGGEAIGHLLSSDAFPLLRQLVLEAVPAMPAILQASRLQAFLLNHSRSLHEVRLKNVFPFLWVEVGQDIPRDPDGDLYPLAHATRQEVDDLTDSIMRLLESARKDLTALRTFKLSVALRDAHDDECVKWPYFKQPLIEGCTGLCKSYALAFGKLCPRATFETLAGSLKIKLENGKWDFGEYVMAQGAGQLTSRFAEL